MAPNESAQAKLGRKGDPRMHRAVSARLANPDISLLQALRDGGFDFPAEGGHDTTLLDAEGVTLGQRKNQLSRRLRLARQAMDENKPIQQSTNHNSASDDPRAEIAKMMHEGSIVGAARQGAVKRGSDALIDQDEDMTDEMVNVDRIAKYHPHFQALFPGVRPGIHLATPEVVVGHHGPSNVAVASLIATSNAVGMTLEQLAMSLSNTPTLFRALSSNPNPEDRLKLAVNLYKTDARALMQKCMLLAGYESAEVIEGHARYMQVALKVWEVEGKRLEHLLGCSDDQQRQGEFCECLPGVGHHISVSTALASNCHKESDSKPSSVDMGGRHVHRLSGKCGHKAIIHQPPGRPAHIDFVVDGKIECYEGIKPVGPKGQGAMWPSRYKCTDLACPTDPVKQHVVCGSDSCCDEQISDDVHNTHPKQLSLTDVDFDGKEWNVDFFAYDGQDDTLLGLIQLGDGDKK